MEYNDVGGGEKRAFNRVGDCGLRRAEKFVGCIKKGWSICDFIREK